jgi:tetratricopeptide (TPR) repeat protein
MGDLVDFGLVQRVADEYKTERFAMPEALRQAAETELDQLTDTEAVRSRHAFLVQRAMDAASWLTMATAQAHRDAEWLGADAAQALDWARHHDPELGAAIAASWSLILADLGRRRESRPLSEFALQVGGGSESVRAQALFAQGITAMQEGDLQTALALGTQALSVVEECDPDRYTEFLVALAGLRGFMGDVDRAVADVLSGVERAQSMGPVALSGALFFEAQVRLFANDPSGALIAHRRAVELGQASGARTAEVVDTQRGDLAFAIGDFSEALAFYLASFDGAVHRGDEGQVTFDLCTIAGCLVGLKRYEAAAEAIGIARAHATEIYATEMFVDQTLERDHTTDRLLTALSSDTWKRCVQTGHTVGPGQRARRVHELGQQAL